MSFVVSTILDGLLVLVLLLLLPATFFCMCQIFILVYILKWSVCIKANERMVAYSILLGSARATPKSNLVYELKIRYLCCFSLVLTCFLFSLLHHRCLLISFAPIMFLVRVFMRYMMGAYVDVFVCDVYIYFWWCQWWQYGTFPSRIHESCVCVCFLRSLSFVYSLTGYVCSYTYSTNCFYWTSISLRQVCVL